MPAIELVRSSAITDSFRVQQIIGMFDLPVEASSSFTAHVELPGMDEDWQIGAIVGPSGSGKSSVAQEAYGEQGKVLPNSIWGQSSWQHDRAVIDGFSDNCHIREITAMLNAVGFSSPPAWLRPYHVLSNGERFRCDLARALMQDQPLVVFDEFTSVVDRQVAQFASAALAKTIRASRCQVKRFIAVTCHYDILEWLSPDWWLDMADGQLARGCLRRPAIRIKIQRCPRDEWARFARHHYLSHDLHPGAWCYLASWGNQPIAFIATIPQQGQKKWRRVHRLVVLPDYQGLGIGLRFLDAIAAYEGEELAFRFSIVSSHPALIQALQRSASWRCVRLSRVKPSKATMHEGKQFGRATVSFRYVNNHKY